MPGNCISVCLKEKNTEYCYRSPVLVTHQPNTVKYLCVISNLSQYRSYKGGTQPQMLQLNKLNDILTWQSTGIRYQAGSFQHWRLLLLFCQPSSSPWDFAHLWACNSISVTIDRNDVSCYSCTKQKTALYYSQWTKTFTGIILYMLLACYQLT